MTASAWTTIIGAVPQCAFDAHARRSGHLARDVIDHRGALSVSDIEPDKQSGPGHRISSEAS
jgi:hypothetical protein